jgi:hypothetical protein
MQHVKLMPDLPDDGPLEDHVLGCLEERGLPTDNLAYRTFEYTRLPAVLQTGTDRDDRSNVKYYEDEDKLMEQAGLSPILHAKQVTWVTPASHLRLSHGKGRPYAIAVYDADQFETLNSANGFSKFKNPFGQYQALVAVFKRD